MPPVTPMLAKLARELPAAGGVVYEPKWDGFRGIVFRDGDEVEIGSRNEKPLTRYFPELVDALRAGLPERCVVDGEIVIATPGGLDFEALQQRIHPAESRIKMLAEEMPASFVAFDLLALGDDDLRRRPVLRAPGVAGVGAWRAWRRRSTSRPPPTTGPWPSSGSTASRAPASTGWWPSPSTSPTGRTSG